MADVQDQIQSLADKYASVLKRQINNRIVEMEADNVSHYLIYRVLGVSVEEGMKIDSYQNTGRFLYRYAGSFLEDAAKLCFKNRFPDAATVRIPNTLGARPKTFEIDCLVNNQAYEIKWRDATTDGDHITKEHTRLRAIAAAGYEPMRVMFYYPSRSQAIKIQVILEDLYKAVGGSYFYGEQAWQHILEKTGINLQQLLEQIAENRGL